MPATETKRPGLLIIDDDEQIRSLLYSILGDEYDCAMVSSAEDALSLLKNIEFDLVISDINMGGISGLDLVPFVLRQAPETVVVMVSGQHTIDVAIQAMRAGAFDYLRKPFDVQHVEAAMQRALAHHRLLAEKKYYQDSLQELLSCRTAEVEHLAYFDSLTDLPNRLLFEDRLTQALKHAQKDNKPVGTVLMRIDRFKEITDTLGPAMGNRLLREIAWRVRKSSDDRGTVARFESDNFALLINDIHGSEDVLELLGDLIESLKVPFVLDDHSLHVTASIGVSLFPVDGETSEELLKNAGIALFRAESVGGDKYQFYQAEMNVRALELLKMEGDLRRAIEAGELRLYYQPQVDLHTHQIVGVEALVRWQHPELGLVQPSRFIPLAEDTGLIVPLGEWCLREACRQLVLWQQNGLDGLRVSVNVSPCQFQLKNFVETVAQILREAEIDPAKLQLEITETSLMNNADDVITRLTELKQMGLMIAIDDFGVGYSSLGYLKRLPIDMLKIDRSFVNDATTDPDDAALVMAIITLAHNLRLKVMAEGVETEDQVRFLALLRCDEAQGFLFGKAEPGEFFNSNTNGVTRNTTLPGRRQSTINQDRELFRVTK
jgi:diguanylate cyclase (GGDEF)-like protein